MSLKRISSARLSSLKGLSLAMVFDKRSTRTRMSFEIGMKQLGGHTIVMNLSEMQLAAMKALKVRRMCFPAMLMALCCA